MSLIKLNVQLKGAKKYRNVIQFRTLGKYERLEAERRCALLAKKMVLSPEQNHLVLVPSYSISRTLIIRVREAIAKLGGEPLKYMGSDGHSYHGYVYEDFLNVDRKKKAIRAVVERKDEL